MGGRSPRGLWLRGHEPGDPGGGVSHRAAGRAGLQRGCRGRDPGLYHPGRRVPGGGTFPEGREVPVTAAIDPEGSGTVTGAGRYQEGATVTLKATPGDGYKFGGWREDGQPVSESETYTFTAEVDRTLTAVCEEKVSRLPEGYTKVEYVKFDKSTESGFGYYTNTRDKIVLDLIPARANTGNYVSYI